MRVYTKGTLANMWGREVRFVMESDAQAEISRLTAERDEATHELAHLKAAIMAKGGTENHPTEDAYLRACRAIEKNKAERDEARASLAAAPALWMEKAEQALERLKYDDADGRARQAFNGGLNRGIVGLRALIPADSAAALRTLRADAVREAAKLIEEGFDRGTHRKADECSHGRYGWEECESCAADALHALADRIEKGEA